MLVLPLMRADAGGTLAVAVLALLVLLIPFRRGELWAFVAVPLGAFVLAACALYAMRTLATNAPASPPYQPIAASIVLGILGLVLSLAHVAG